MIGRALNYGMLAALIGMAAGLARAAPALEEIGGRTVVTGADYRVTFRGETLGFDLELRDPRGAWHPVTEKPGETVFAYASAGALATVNGLRATWRVERRGETVVAGQQLPLDPIHAVVLELHFVCSDEGLLIGARFRGAEAIPEGSLLWSPPRISLAAQEWDSYLFWSPGRAHGGRIADLDPMPAYAGVSAWEPTGDTVPRLDAARPALIIGSRARGLAFGVTFLDYETAWRGAASFFQRHTLQYSYLYAGHLPARMDGAVRWAWLAPFPLEPERAGEKVARLLADGRRLTEGFRPLAPSLPDHWLRPLPDFPAELRRPRPVEDIRQAVVFTINETTNSGYGIDLARKVGSDVLIRGWFKWAQAPPVQAWSDLPEQARELGALFGGGITCSALYDSENGITRGQLLDMATRNPRGDLVDAWDEPGVRHGSLSSPAYLDYLFRWCREQIDAGVDYLFMDEINAALGALEGYDDHSLADFRRYLLQDCPETRGWAPDDRRWGEVYRIDLGDPEVCPDGVMGSFDYRAYLRARDSVEAPTGATSPLASPWLRFRRERDTRAWRELTGRIRRYAAEQGRTVYLSANGLAPLVDLQVLGVWGRWQTDNGHIDLSEDQLPVWRSIVANGHAAAGGRVPVVLFHDWGFGDPPFPWLAVPPSEREIWMRTRGAEIYAAGGFFAFPVLGPFGCDAARDGTLATIAAQTAFYQRHRDLYREGGYIGSEALRAGEGDLSLAAWWSERESALLIHAVNRRLRDRRLATREGVTVRIPVATLPADAQAISPDGPDEIGVASRRDGNDILLTLPRLEAYAVAVLRYPQRPDLSRLQDPVRVLPVQRWEPAARTEFPLRPDRLPEHGDELNGFIQGRLHTHLRNAPTFLVHALTEGALRVRVRAVASVGARLEYRVDGETVDAVDLPDRDGRNDGDAPEYDQVLAFPIPAGRHRLALDNTGPDWLTVAWYEFAGEFGEWEQQKSPASE